MGSSAQLGTEEMHPAYIREENLACEVLHNSQRSIYPNTMVTEIPKHKPKTENYRPVTKYEGLLSLI